MRGVGKCMGDCEVLIVGAGPTGLSLACSLAHQGVKPRIIDKNSGPAVESRALAIQPRTLELFDQWGIADEIAEEGHPLSTVNIYNTDKDRLARLEFQSLRTPFPFVLALPQSETERALQEHAESLGISVERDTELLDFEQTDGQVAVKIKKGETTAETDFQWLVGCDGAHSHVRDKAGIRFEGGEIPGTFLLADVEVEWPMPLNEAQIFATSEGLFACFPLREGLRIVASQRYDGERSAPTAEDVAEMLQHRGPAGAKLKRLSWSSVFYIHSRLVRFLRQGRVFLAGDAAHIHSPALAQGMNTGIQDAANLGWKLAMVVKKETGPYLLDSYGEERKPVESGVLSKTSFATRLMTGENGFVNWLRNLVGPGILKNHWVQEQIGGIVSELAIGYPKSNIVVPHGEAGNLGPGQRAPDGWLIQNGLKRRFCEFMRRPGHLVLLCTNEPEYERFEAEFAELPYKIHAECAIPLDTEFITGHFYIIRPDGYIGGMGNLGAVRDILREYEAMLQIPVTYEQLQRML